MDALDQVSLPPKDEVISNPADASADRWIWTCRLLTCATGLSAVALMTLWWSAGRVPAIPVLVATRHTLLIPVALTSLMLAMAGFIGTWVMAWARRRAVSAPVTRASGWRRLLHASPRGEAVLIGRMARWPQAMTITLLMLVTVGCAAWMDATAMMAAVAPSTDILFGAAALVMAFPLLISERWLASVPAPRLPEAPGLRALVLLPVLAWTAAGLAQIAAGLGVPFTRQFDLLLLLALGIVWAELWLRALGRCFLPPPDPSHARAAVDSLLAGIVGDGLRERSLVAPVRHHLGIDFSRSWALAYLRAAMPPVMLMLLLVCWALSGVVLVGPDQRAAYERFGAPVTVLHPGAHVTLPWPMGQIRREEFGPVHETTLTGNTTVPAEQGTDTMPPLRLTGAEDRPPPEADRLWEQAHPGELTFLISSRSTGKQTFQVVSADIKLRYRVGLTDQAVLLAAYRVADPVALLCSSAGRVIGRFLAGQTLDAVLGTNREDIADRLRDEVQHELDAAESGLELVAVVVEAIHPPAGAANAYHNVQAAEIRVMSSIAAERGRALANQSKASQYATEIVAQARAAAAETTGTAAGDLTRFNAEHAAFMAGGQAFLLERRLTAIAAGLAKSMLTIIDHRIPAADAPVLDLRPLSPVTTRSTGANQE